MFLGVFGKMYKMWKKVNKNHICFYDFCYNAHFFHKRCVFRGKKVRFGRGYPSLFVIFFRSQNYRPKKRSKMGRDLSTTENYQKRSKNRCFWWLLATAIFSLVWISLYWLKVSYIRLYLAKNMYINDCDFFNRVCFFLLYDFFLLCDFFNRHDFFIVYDFFIAWKNFIHDIKNFSLSWKNFYMNL